MKEGTRLYINITNKCNVRCPFCCMYSGPEKNTFMNFNTFMNIVDGCGGKFELQLEGGEPLLHKDIFLFIEYAIHTGRCSKVIILSNGLELDKHLKRFIDIANWNNVPFEFKLSVNEYLEKVYEKQKYDIYVYMGNLLFATKYIKNVSIILNVRATHDNMDDIRARLEVNGLLEHSNVFYLQSYGRMSDDDAYEKPVIVQNIDNWRIYASDGTCWGQDLVARSEHEKTVE